MAFRVVGAVGIKVRPDTTKFHEELTTKLKSERDVEIQIPVVPARDVSKEKLDQWARAASAKAASEGIRVRIPATLGADTILKDVKTRVDLINDKLDTNKSIRVKIPAIVDDKALAASAAEAVRTANKRVKELPKVEIPATVEVDTTKAERELKHFIDKESGKNIDLDADLDRRGIARAQLDTLTRPRDISLRVRIEKRTYATAVAAIQGLTGLNVVKNAGRIVEDLTKNIDKYALSVGKIGIAFGNLANLTGTGVGGLAAVAGNLLQLGGAALTLPAAAASVAAFVTVSIAAFKNFKAAVDGDADALNSLPANAQAAAKALHGVWSSIQVPVQEAFWSKMGTGLQDMVTSLVDEFRGGLTEVGAAAGTFAKSVTDGFTLFAKQDVFRNMFGRLATGITNTSKGIAPLVHAFITIGDQGSKFLPEIGDYLAKQLQTFDQWITRAAQAGKITDWIQNAATQAGHLKDALKDAYGIFHDLTSAARNAGFGGLENLADVLDHIHEVTTGPGFQNTMATLFDGARVGAKKLGEALGPLGSAIDDLAPTLASVMSSVGGTLGGLVTSVANALHSSTFKNGLSGLFSGIETGVQGFDRYVQSIVDGLGSLGSLSGAVFRTTLPVVGQFFATMSDTLGRLEQPLENVASALSGSLSRGITLIGQVAGTAAGPISTLLDLFTKLPSGVQDAILAVAGIRKLTNAPSLKQAFGLGPGSAIDVAGITARASAAGKAAAQAVQDNFAERMSTLTPAMQRIMQQDAFGTFFRNIGVSVNAGLASVGARLKTFGSAIGTGLVSAGKSFVNFLGGPWGVALVGASLALSVYSDSVQQLQQRYDDARQAAMDLATAMLNNPQNPIGNLDAENAAFTQAQDLIRDAKALGLDLSGQTNGIIDVILGRPDASALQGLQDLQKIASQGGGSGLSRTLERTLSFGNTHEAQDWANLNVAIQGVLGTADSAGDILKQKLAQPAQLVATQLQLAGQYTEEFGTITAKNVPDIQQYFDRFGKVTDGVESFAIGIGNLKTSVNTGLVTNIQKMAQIMADSLGGASTTIRANFDTLSAGLEKFGDDSQSIVKFMMADGFTNPQITKVLEVLHYTVDQVADAFSANLLPLLGNTLSVVPGMARSVADALTAIRTQVLAQLGPNGIKPDAVFAFSDALKALASNASDAATQASGLRDALDQLNGGKLDTTRLMSQMFSDWNSLKSQFEDNTINWSKVLDSKGAIDITKTTGQQLFAGLDKQATDAAAVAIDAYNKAFATTGDYAKAADAAQAATSGLATTIEQQLVKSLGISQTQADSLLTTFDLWPDQLVTDATVNARGATDPLAQVLGMMQQLGAGAVIPVGAQTDNALAALKSVGLKVQGLADGSYAISVDADPTKAQNEIKGLEKLLNSTSYTIDVDVNANLNPFYHQVRGVRLGPAAIQADGGIIEKAFAFANGGITKALSSVRHFANGENHVAQIARGLRIWAEPETDGEAYIPLAASKRPRSLEILADVANRFGYMLTKADAKIRAHAYDSGGASYEVVSPGAPVFNINNNFPQAEPTSKTISKAARLLASYGV